MRQLSEKLLSLDDVVSCAESLKAKNKTVVTTNGCFDILHRGHVQYLNEARQLGDFLIVGLNSDSSVQKLKGTNRPINNQEDRQYCLAGLASVDVVFIFEEATPVEWLKKIKPHIHVKGEDYKGKNIPEKIIETWGGILKFIPFVPGKSTTATIEQLKRI